MFNLANTLTLIRIGAVPAMVLLLYFPSRIVCWLAAVLFILASITDLLDGFVARRQGQVTNVGKFLDPLADKLLVGSVMIMLVHLHWLPAWIAVVIICRELAVTGLRAVASERGVVMAADRFGKLKTVLQIVALVPLTIHYPFWGLDPASIGMMIMYLAVILTVFSGGNYLYIFYRNWLEKG